MIVDKDLAKYIVETQVTLSDALVKLNENKLQILFVVDSQRKLKGAFTDGDFRRWVLNQKNINIQLPVAQAMNKNCQSVFEDVEHNIVIEHLNEKVRYLPIVDNNAKLIAIASRQPEMITIEGRIIGPDSACYVIAEIGNNHNGSLQAAKDMVDASINAGASAVKFQMRDLSSLYVNSGDAHDVKEDLGSQYVLDLLSRFQLSDSDFGEIFEYCRQHSITPLCTPFDRESADKLMALNISAFKVASADLTNHDFLRYLSGKNLPLIVSTGMASEQEIQDASVVLNAEGARFVLLHCNSTYPAPFKDINLNYMGRLSQYSQGFIGYSGHERGYAIPIAAVARGAKVIEKHFTLDRQQEGNDHKVSLLPDEFKEMVTAIRQVEAAMGSNLPRKISQGEMMNRESLGKSVIADVSIAKGEKITRKMLAVKSPGKGLAPYYLDKLIGMQANRDIDKNDFFYHSDYSNLPKVAARHFDLPQDFGIPVRYHDMQLITQSNLTVVEFHLSYKDLLVDPSEYVNKNSQMRLVVHAPELFESDHVLDLASDEAPYRALSIKHLNKVLNLARELSPFYPRTRRVPVVVNAGGFSQNDFLSQEHRQQKYSVLGQSLTQLDLSGIDLLIQSMPPFPWHFGGQRYHNLFICPQEIYSFCQEHQVNVCLDVSHSWLACNQFGYTIEDFFLKLGPFIKHLHIADAAGVDDEGLQVGEGEMSMILIFELMKKHCAQATWIPEIWQGHKNQGEGFWVAFSRLEQQLAHTSN
ncbi:N-acetylneuraminate synthase [Glaciecola sp. 4H-3-7+YE-5]|uniref:N-acetylneuraminate synthase n=1 Tax=Paraglaciecola agarilytica NO2 TaxID=1125747 RepID=A0ABQ0I878_9ALTE|nr:N-acetylneuraminate synthase family protein [Paraglaciecola agarilytica]AEE22235.1 N-acetylneuraminate synthase [Glaciecola sp. 4H-3-7+YE-5]GAC05473.1 N-acetylneuraminate synthase [Paraglaciecola agarilytica NO2]